MSVTAMLDRFSERDRRALIFLAAAVVPVLLWLGAVRPYRAALEDLRTRVQTERSLLQREQALLAVGHTLPDSLKAARSHVRKAEMSLVYAPNLPLAEAELTTYLEEVATQSRVLLQEMTGVDPVRGEEPPEGVSPIRLAVRGESDLTGVLIYLRRLEEGPLLVRIRELEIQRAPEQPQAQQGRGGRGRGQQQSAPRNRGAVTFAFVAEAYAPREEGNPTSAPEEVSP